MRFVTHLESAIDSTQYDANQLQTMHEHRPLWVRYDLDRISRTLTKSELRARPASLWRYRELLPVGDDITPVSLGEPMSPLIPCQRLGQSLRLGELWIKDESQLPTSSFKCRGLSMAVTMAKHFGRTRLAMASNGNAAGALAAYSARGGVEAVVIMPNVSDPGSQFECFMAGAHTFLAAGMIDECGKLVRRGHEENLWFDVSTMKEPYRLEGKKTMGLEIAEQFQWQLPDVIVYPTGGGTALIGMWKAFTELREMGWLESSKMPRMIAVQSDGCCPIVRAYQEGKRFTERFENAHSKANGIRVPYGIGDFMILDALSESGGCAVSVDENRLLEWQKFGGSQEGISIGLETAACIGSIQTLIEEKKIDSSDRVLIVNTGSAQKYWAPAEFEIPTLDLKNPGDLNSLLD